MQTNITIEVKINNPVKVSFDVTWYKGTDNETTKTIERLFDLGKLTSEDLLEYALRPLIITEQTKLRNKKPADAELTGTVEVGAPGTRSTNPEKLGVVETLMTRGLSKDQALNFSKLMAKDETMPAFLIRLQGMLGALGLTINLVGEDK